MRLETNVLGKIAETKEITIDGQPVGVIKGYIASWQPDAYPGIYGVKDRIMPGAYSKSIENHKARGNRQVRLKFQHNKVIGGFPIDTVTQDAFGLLAEGRINLNIPDGRDAYALAKQGVLVDMSVGHIVTREELADGFRNIIEADLLEGSIVDEPANQAAKILEVKARWSDLPIHSDDSYEWNEAEARARVLEFKCGEEQNPLFIGNLLIGDIINGEIKVIPEALNRAARDITNINDQVIMERYFAKMGVSSPFGRKAFYVKDDITNKSRAELKDMLVKTGIFSHGAVRAIMARIDDEKSSSNNNALLEEIVSLTKSLTNN